MYGLYLLCHANGQTHVCLIALSVKIITKCIAVVYQFKSPGWFHVETYMHAFLGCDMPIQLVLSSEYDDYDRLEDRFIMYQLRHGLQ